MSDSVRPKRAPSKRRSPARELTELADRMRRIEVALEEAKKANEQAKGARTKWGERAWDLFKTILAALIIAGLLYAAEWVRCVPPPPPTTGKIEVRP